MSIFSSDMWFCRTLPMHKTGKKCNFLWKYQSTWVLFTDCYLTLSSVLTPKFLCFLKTSPTGWLHLPMEVTYGISCLHHIPRLPVGLLLKVTLDRNGNNAILLCAAYVIMRTYYLQSLHVALKKQKCTPHSNYTLLLTSRQILAAICWRDVVPIYSQTTPREKEKLIICT